MTASRHRAFRALNAHSRIPPTATPSVNAKAATPTSFRRTRATTSAPTPRPRKSRELRLASEERVAGIFDYVIGGLYDDIDAPVRLTQETPLPGGS